MTKVKWIDSKKKLPEHKQRILFYRPEKLTKIGEMIFFKTEETLSPDGLKFSDLNPYWAEALEKPEEFSV